VRVRNRHTLPDDPFDQLKGDVVFFKTNLLFGYPQLRVEEDILKTSFRLALSIMNLS
jgi:hypothetical protein